jgi:hypothetical protein
VFEIPLQNVVVAPGADVLLKCIITANPPPQGRCRAHGLGVVGRQEGSCQSLGSPDPRVFREIFQDPHPRFGRATWASRVRADPSEFLIVRLECFGLL